MARTKKPINSDNNSNIDGVRQITITESWYKQIWQPAAFFIYLLICVFDFFLMPAIYEARKPKIEDMINLTLKYQEPSSQVQALTTLIRNQNSWTPITLEGGGLFHMAFGAILTGAAITRGMERTERVRMIGNDPYGRDINLSYRSKTSYTAKSSVDTPDDPDA